MRYSTTLSMLSGIAALSSFAMAHPQLVKRVDSPDDTCGLTVGGAPGNGYTCTSANTGTCCSQYGFCGSTADYCGTGCQDAYGTGCTPGGGGGTDPNLCGPANGGNSCVTGSCCSVNGFCGTTDDYCLPANGCQAAYGICNSTSTGGGGGTLTDCGPTGGNAVCPTGQCCSPAGFCGTTEDYCTSPDCQRGFGTCDSDQTPAGASTADIPRPLIGNVPYNNDIYDCNDPGHIALTFDDGPYIYTNDLLDKLAAYNFKATFFITGVNNGKGAIDSTPAWTSVIQRMITDGHQVASHTWSHADLSTLTEADRRTEMIKNEMALRNIIGKIPTYMRPPYSSCNAACEATLLDLGYHVTYFDLDTQDYLHTTPETNQISKDLVHAIISAANPATSDFLAIAHDIHEQTVHNFTTSMFDDMVTYGFTGVAVGTCLGDAQANWYRAAGSNTTTSSSSSSSSTTTTSSSSSSSSSSTETTTSTSTSSSSTTTLTSTSTTNSSTTTTSSSTGSSSSTTSTTLTTTTKPTTKPTTTQPTTKPTTTKPTTKPTKSTTQPTTKPTTKPTTTKPTTKPTKTKTTSTAAPTSTCAYPLVGNWCPKPFNFNNKLGCLVAEAACAILEVECQQHCGLGSDKAKQLCGGWVNNVCQKLDTYCSKNCSIFGQCDSSLFTV